MKKINRNYSQLDRCILETANSKMFIDKDELMSKVMEKQMNNGITENDISECLQRLTEQRALSFHNCYCLEDRQIANEFIIKVTKIMIPIVITAGILTQVYLMFFLQRSYLWSQSQSQWRLSVLTNLVLEYSPTRFR